MDGVGEHECWVEVHQVSEPQLSEEEEWETLTAVYGPFVASFGTTPQSLSRGWHIRGVPFPAPGWYEFQLMTKGVVLAQEPVYLED